MQTLVPKICGRKGDLFRLGCQGRLLAALDVLWTAAFQAQKVELATQPLNQLLEALAHVCHQTAACSG